VTDKQSVANWLSRVLGRPVSPFDRARALAAFDGWERTFDVWDAELPEQLRLIERSHEGDVETFLAKADCRSVLLVFHSRKQSEGKKPRTHALKPHCDDPGCLVGSILSECTACGEKGVSAAWNCAGPRATYPSPSGVCSPAGSTDP